VADELGWLIAHRSALRVDHPLAPHTSLRVGGPARYYVESKDSSALGEALAAATRDGVPVLTLGGGSNLLIADSGFEGLVIKHVAADYQVASDQDGSGVLTAASGATIASLARRLAREGWSGLEWAANVPGTIGGAAVNNAGAFDSCMAECLIGLAFLDSRATPVELSCAELSYEYRSSVLKRGELGPLLVTTVRCKLHRDDPAAAVGRVADFQRRRTATQPRQLSAGSVFANPTGDFSGRLIESAGLKRTRVGGAEISAQHANFIVNVGGATAADVYNLIRLAQEAVWAKSGMWLRPEIQLVGGWRPAQLAALDGPPGERDASPARAGRRTA